MGEEFNPEVFLTFLNKTDAVCHMSHVTLKMVIFDQRDIEFAKEVVRITDNCYTNYLSLGNPLPPPATSDGTREYLKDFEVDLLKRMKVLWEDIQNEPELRDAIFLPQLHVLLWGNEQGR
jgi:hypothetical protein